MSMTHQPEEMRTIDDRDSLRIALPPRDVSLAQDEEWCVVETEDGWEEIHIHDYDRLYSIPGLYESLIYDILKCDSPATVRGMLADALEDVNAPGDSLRVLDLGAGNGMVAEELREIGVKHVVGVDIIEAAAESAERDREGLYADYLVTDMSALSDEERKQLAAHNFNCLVCVAALGFGDIPVRVFSEAFNLIANEGWIAFNIKEDFLDEHDTSGFSTLIRTMQKRGILSTLSRQRYQHRPWAPTASGSRTSRS